MTACNNGLNVIPDCRCGRGKMMLLCAGKGAAHSGRYFYKCPANMKHAHSFLWCDEYHKNDPTDKIPEYVLKHVYIPKPIMGSSHSSTSLVRDMTVESQIRPARLRSDIEVQIAFGFMAIVLILFGAIIGKLV